MELEYRFATVDDIENLMQTRLDMLRVVNNLGPDYVYDDDFVRSSREYFLNGDQISVLAVCGDKTVGCASMCFIEMMPTFAHPIGEAGSPNECIYGCCLPQARDWFRDDKYAY